MRVSPGSDVSSSASIEQSVMIAGHDRGHGRGRGRDFGGRGRGFVGGKRVSYEGTQSAFEKTPCNICIVDIVIMSLKSAGRNLVDLSGDSYLILFLCPVWYSSEFFICYS